LKAAQAWIAYWGQREVGWEWIAEEMLPGRDYGWTSIWNHGELVTSQGRERVEYIYPHLAPSGRTGTPTIAVTRHDQRVNDVASAAVIAIDDDATGVFCVDLRENARGVPVPTEINAGRFFTTSDFYAAAGFNFVDLYIRLGMGEEIERVPKVNAVQENVAWYRHIDCPARLVEGIPGLAETKNLH
jgi:carbamoyl-phosphate synthase large subunit